MNILKGISVFGLTHGVAGPVCTQYLASLGADVIKIEPPGGEEYRGLLNGASFAAFNNFGKKSMSIDLKSDESDEIVRTLIERSDVFVTNYSPRVVDKFDLDRESVWDIDRDTIYCSITGFGRDGPYSSRPAFDPIIQAMSGIMSVTGHPDSDSVPPRVGIPIIDVGTGMNAAFLVMAALYTRAITGEAIDVETSLFDTAVSFTGYQIPKYSGTGDIPTPQGSKLHGIAPYGVYAAKNNELFFLGAQTDRLFEKLCTAIDREDLITDERFKDNQSRWKNRAALRDELERTFRGADVEDLTVLLSDAGIPAGPINDFEDVVNDPHVSARDMLMDSHNISMGTTVSTPRPPYRIAEEVVESTDSPPETGEHTDEILKQLGVSELEIDRLRNNSVIQ